MQSFSSTVDARPRLLVVELWGVGDVALAVPFLQAAARSCRVTLLAKPHAAALVRQFCPAVEHVPLTAPWTAHRGKYQLPRWPWRELSAVITTLRGRRFSAAVSARPDPRDHALMIAASVGWRAGFPRAGSRLLLDQPLPSPSAPHRAEYWAALAAALNLPAPAAAPAPAHPGRHVVIHTGAAQPTREWPRERFDEIARRLGTAGWRVTVLDGSTGGLDDLLQTLATADRFIGNDSGPGHLAALLGVPTFTLFSAQLPQNFHPVHPAAAWLEGARCPHKPCNDYCRFAEPHCIRDVTVESVWSRLTSWIDSP